MGASRKTIREWIAGELGRKHVVTQSGAVGGSPSGTEITFPNIRDIVGDNERFEDAYLAADIDADEVLEWRRITAVNVDTGVVVINRPFDTPGANDQEYTVYTMLNPDEWNDAINEELVTLYFKERLEVDIDDFIPSYTKEFFLSSETASDSDSGHAIGATWLQYSGQIIAVRYRNTTTGYEQPVTGYKWREHRNAVTLVLSAEPPASSTYTIIIEAMRYYPKLNQEDWGTTCPTPLWQAAIKVAAIRKVINKFGERMKRQWGMALQIAEKEYYKMRAQVLPNVIAREYAEEDWNGVDVDDFFEHSGWV